MKPTPRLASPPDLMQYRTDHPEDLSRSGAEAKEVWDRFRNSPAYKATMKALVETQQGLCAYCEQSTVWMAEELEEAEKKGLRTGVEGSRIELDSQIEHVQAKADGVGRALDPENLALCCCGGSRRELKDFPDRYAGPTNESCGQAKDSPEGKRQRRDRKESPGWALDPRTLALSPAFVHFEEDSGLILIEESACVEMGLNPEAVRSEIVDVLRLNCERLAGARRKHLAKADTHRTLLHDLAKDLRASDQLLKKYVEALTEEMLAPNKHGHLQPFWSVWRQALAPFSERWIETNRARLNLSVASP